MEERVIRIKVDADDVGELSSGLENLGTQFDVVDAGASSVGEAIDRLDKQKGVLVILDRLTGGWASKITKTAKGLKDVVKGLNSTKAALIATGIGVFVVALGIIVAYWDDIVEFITGANKLLQEQINILEYKLDLFSDEIKILELQEKLLKKRGESSEKITEEKIKFIKLQMVENELLLTLLATQLQLEKSKAEEYGWWELIKNAARFQVGLPPLKLIDEEEQQRIQDITDQINDARIEAEQLKLDLFDAQNPKSKKIKRTQARGARREKEEKVDTITGEEMDAERDRLSEYFAEIFDLNQIAADELQEAADMANERFLMSEEVAQAKRTALEQKEADARSKIADLEADMKIETYWNVSDAFEATSQLIGKQTAAGKAFSVASALISTYLSAQQAFQSQVSTGTLDGPIRGAIAAGAAIISGLANVKAILSVKVPGGGGGGGGGNGVGASAPSFNVIDNSPQNQLNQSLLEQNNEPIQAFVVEGEVTSAQALTNSKIEDASF